MIPKTKITHIKQSIQLQWYVAPILFIFLSFLLSCLSFGWVCLLFLLIFTVIVIDFKLKWFIDRLLAGLGVVGLLIMIMFCGVLVDLYLLIMVFLRL